MINRILTGWTFIRALRLILGIVIVVQSVSTKDWTLAFFGSLFTMMPLLNLGCCPASGCATPATQKENTQETSYEDVH